MVMTLSSSGEAKVGTAHRSIPLPRAIAADILIHVDLDIANGPRADIERIVRFETNRPQHLFPGLGTHDDTRFAVGIPEIERPAVGNVRRSISRKGQRLDLDRLPRIIGLLEDIEGNGSLIVVHPFDGGLAQLSRQFDVEDRTLVARLLLVDILRAGNHGQARKQQYDIFQIFHNATNWDSDLFHAAESDNRRLRPRSVRQP